MIPIKPKDVIWTDEQWQAIYDDKSNIIVSAGAGSGKTAVLTERIIEKLKSGISLNNLIVLTFTNAAAFEMKERVRKKIIKEIENGNNFLKKELLNLPNSIITTFDSFSLSLLKKYHYILDIPKNINIIDNVVITNKKKELMDEVFTEFYEKKDNNFLDFIDTFTVKDDQKIKNLIIAIDNKLNNLINVDDYLNNYIENYFNNEFIELQIKNYIKILNNYKGNINLFLNKLKELTSTSLLNDWFIKVENVLTNLNNCVDYSDYKELTIIKLPTFPINKELDEDYLNIVKKEYNELKSNFNVMKELCSYDSVDEIKEEILMMKASVEIIISILKQYRIKISDYKKEHNSYEFYDIALMAIELMKQNSYIANEYKNNINEIMIDEYQDTNDIQDYFISLIANNNIYMVGDVKQSIYGFRNANPNIFMTKYDNYKNNIGGKAIDLNRNFRSRSEVISAINNIFNKIMDQNIGGADYINHHQMIFGNLSYNEKGYTNQNNELEILNYEYLDNRYKKDELEAFIIANDINNKIKNNYQVFAKELRNIKYSDFCILMDRKTSFELYRKIFTYLNIPIKVHSEVTLNLSNELYVIRSILRLVLSLNDKEFYNKYFEHAFISLARSFLYSYNDDEIFNIFLESKNQNIDIVKILLGSSMSELIKNIIDINEYYTNQSLVELIDYIYDKFDIYNKLNLLDDVEGRTIKLEYFRNVVNNLENSGYTLKDLCDYLDNAIDNKIDITFNIDENDVDAVNIMTIHKSKGLEYPICYYAGLSKKFNKDDLKEKYTFDNCLGIVTPIFKEGIKETIYKNIMKYNYEKKDIAERLRVFYVALTRAKEKLIIVSDLISEDEELTNNIVSDNIRLKYKSFKDVLLSLPRTLKCYINNINLNNVSLSKDYEVEKDINLFIDKDKHIDYETIDINVEPEEIIGNHYSVSPIIIDKKTNENLEIGLKFHGILEYIDFKDINKSVKELDIDNNLKDKISNLMSMPFMKNIKDYNIYHEYEFIYNDNEKTKHGIIDLLLENEAEYIIVDYKTKEINKDIYYDQVGGYMNYIKKISNKKVSGYIYSIIDGEYIEVVEK